MSQLECEVKILEIDVEKIRTKLQVLGAVEVFNDHIAAEFFRNATGLKIRLRKMGNKNILTYKVVVASTFVLQAEEVEVLFDNYEGMKQILISAGFEQYGKSEKHHMSYEYQSIHFDIDTMADIPTFLEVEASNADDVKRGVELIGHTMNQTVTLTERTLKEHYGIN